MPSVLAYHRPASLEEAASLLAEPRRVVLGGGTVAVPEARQPDEHGVEVVDLQGLGLDRIEPEGDGLRIGAMVRLGELQRNDQAPELLRDLARRELPSALRNQASIGGTVALAESSSVLLAGLLVHDAEVSLHPDETVALASLQRPLQHRIVTGVSIATGGRGAIVATGRTPADEPIVAAVARATDGEVRLALTGVAPAPVLVDPDDPTGGLTPPADFRGSAEYRLHLAATLSARALAQVSS